MTNTLMALFLAVCQVENPNHIKGRHPDGVSYGVAGVTARCLTDVNKETGLGYTLAEMDNPAKAYLVFAAYTELRCRVKKLEPTNRNRLLVWHAASDPAEQERYIKAVEAEIEKADVSRASRDNVRPLVRCLLCHREYAGSIPAHCLLLCASCRQQAQATIDELTAAHRTPNGEAEGCEAYLPASGSQLVTKGMVMSNFWNLVKVRFGLTVPLLMLTLFFLKVENSLLQLRVFRLQVLNLLEQSRFPFLRGCGKAYCRIWCFTHFCSSFFFCERPG